MNTSNPVASLWKRRWGPAYQWESLVCCEEFRRNATIQYYDIYSNRKLYQDEAPGGLNYCARCAAGQRYDCLFFHPSLADIYLDLIKELGKTKLGSIADMTNLEFLDRVFRVLPGHFTELGFPCQLGGIWRCIVDKLDLTFPLGDLVMLDVASFVQYDNFPQFDIYGCCNNSSSDGSTSSLADEEDDIKITNKCSMIQATGENKKLVDLKPATHQTKISVVKKKQQVLSFKNPYQRK